MSLDGIYTHVGIKNETGLIFLIYKKQNDKIAKNQIVQ